MQTFTYFTDPKIAITKFLWGDFDASPPQLFGRRGDRPHGVGAYGGMSSISI